MTKQEFLRQIEIILECPQGNINEASKLNDIGWDSLSVVSFIALIDKEFQISIAADDINSCETVNELMELLKEKITA